MELWIKCAQYNLFSYVYVHTKLGNKMEYLFCYFGKEYKNSQAVFFDYKIMVKMHWDWLDETI